MNPSIGYFILSIVVLGVLSFIYMVVGVGGIGGGGSLGSKFKNYRALIVFVGIIYAIIVTCIGGATALGAAAVAALIVFIFWGVQR